MGNKIRQKFLLYPLFALLFIYLISILFFSQRILFVTCTAVDLLVILIIALTLKHIGNNKIYYKLFLVAIITDTLPYVLYTVPSGYIKNITDAIYLIPNIIYCGWLVVFVFRELKSWNKYQFFSDIFIISTIGFAIMWSLFIIRHNYLINISYNLVIIIIYIFLDFCILSICALVFLSKGIKNIFI